MIELIVGILMQHTQTVEHTASLQTQGYYYITGQVQITEYDTNLGIGQKND